MEVSAYRRIASLEKEHWWFVARRHIVESIISKLDLSTEAKIFEVGCGSGGNLLMLSRHGAVFAMELNEEARVLANRLKITDVQGGALPNTIPFPEHYFDLILLLDVLEHLEDDTLSLAALKKYLKPGGYLLITVPALPLLWSKHDEIHHHYRRYLKHTLSRSLENANYVIHMLSYFNMLLSPLIILERLRQRFFGAEHHDLEMPPTWLNNILKLIFTSEKHLISRVRLPIGISLISLAKSKSYTNYQSN